MVEVIENINPNGQATEQGINLSGMVNWDIVIIVVGLAIIGLIIFTIFYKLISWFVKKIKDARRKGNNLEYFKYHSDLRLCRINQDSRYRKRNILTCFLTWKKAKVYANTSFGRKLVGYYDGEAIKKEGFFIIGLEQRESFFKRETDIVLLPAEFRKHLVRYNDDFSIDIEAEGIDETISSEYFSIPVFKNTGNKELDKMFVDFSNLIMEKYFKEYVYRQVIKDNMIDFSNNIREATEINSVVQYKRKTGDDLRE